MKLLASIIILSLLFLSGCASKTAQSLGPEALTRLAVANKDAEAKCFEVYGKSFEVNCDGMDSRDCGYVKMQAETRKLMMEVAGKGSHPCYNPDNLWAFMSEEVREMNATFRSVGGNVLDLGKWIVGGDVAKAGIKKMGDSIHQSVGGDGSPSASTTREEINNEEVATGGVGEGAQGGSTSGAGSGVSDPVPTVTEELPVGTEPVTVSED